MFAVDCIHLLLACAISGLLFIVNTVLLLVACVKMKNADLRRHFYFLQYFDTVGWVIRPVKPVPNMTYNVFSRTLNPTQSINSSLRSDSPEQILLSYGIGLSVFGRPFVKQFALCYRTVRTVVLFCLSGL